MVDTGQGEVFEAEEGFVLNVGDAGLLDFSINEQPGRSLGPSGQTVTVAINRDNYRTFLAPE